jgi:hypothetical protein
VKKTSRLNETHSEETVSPALPAEAFFDHRNVVKVVAKAGALSPVPCALRPVYLERLFCLHIFILNIFYNFSLTFIFTLNVVTILIFKSL